MKACVFIYLIYVILSDYVETFEYHEEYNTEDEERSLDYYRALQAEETSSYGPVLTPITHSNDNSVPNHIPYEENVKIPQIPEETTQQEIKKPYYDEKDAPELFQKFIKDFNKQYKDEEEYNRRYQNFVKNLKDINQLNKEQDATFDINMFADLGEGESIIG